MIAKSSPPLSGGLYMNKKAKALGGGTTRKKPKGEGFYMKRKPKALDGSDGDNVFKKVPEKLKKNH